MWMTVRRKEEGVLSRKGAVHDMGQGVFAPFPSPGPRPLPPFAPPFPPPALPLDLNGTERF
jgi:hypothetical protein